MAITLRGLYSVAKGYGYKGSDSDAAAMKAYLLGLKDENGNPSPVEAISDGTTEFETKSLVFNDKPNTRRQVATIVADDQPEDFDAKIKAGVEASMKAMGFDPAKGKRPGVIGSDIGHVKGSDERIYDNRVAMKQSVFSKYDYAYGFGSDLQVKALRAMGKHSEADAIAKTVSEQLTQKGYTLLTTAAGSALVPEGYDSDLHQLLLQYGVARKAARVVQMSSETVVRPKATGDLTVYYPADGSAGTESTKTWSNVQLRAKEGMVIVKASRAITQDSVINIADDAGRDIVRAVAKCEDNTLFNSNGSGAVNGYIPQTSGILHQIGTGGASAATAFVQTTETSSNSRVYKAAATTPGAVTIAELTAFMATPGNFVGRQMAFHCTQQIASAIFYRLAASVGGIQPMQLAGLGMVPTFLGVPILINNVMTTALTTTANRQLVVYGDLSLAADFGDRMGLAVEISDQRYWDENNIGIKGTVRHDINVHALGATGTAGPVAVLIQT